MESTRADNVVEAPSDVLITTDRNSGGGAYVTSLLKGLLDVDDDLVERLRSASLRIRPRGTLARGSRPSQQILVPQNALAYTLRYRDRSTWFRWNALAAATLLSRRSCAGQIRIGPSIPERERGEPIVPNVLQNGDSELLQALKRSPDAEGGTVLVPGPFYTYKGVADVLAVTKRWGERRPVEFVGSWPGDIRPPQRGGDLLTAPLRRFDLLMRIRDSAAVVLPSYIEASPITLLESATLARRVLARSIEANRVTAEYSGLHDRIEWFANVEELEVLLAMDKPLPQAPEVGLEMERIRLAHERWCRDIRSTLMGFAQQTYTTRKAGRA